jgi:nicotinate-nucleotide adenylyltransferase
VGLLGGSFNPAHEGHLHISREALKRLGLDEIWWMVSPRNPLKPARGMAPFPARLASARKLARSRRIKVTGIEQNLGTRFTADTLRTIKRRFPRLRFVWLMGADNLAEIPNWEEWAAIFRAAPIAVFTRPTYSLRALAGKAAQRFRHRRRAEHAARRIAAATPPAWVFLNIRPHPASATSIRAARKKDGRKNGRGIRIKTATAKRATRARQKR